MTVTQLIIIQNYRQENLNESAFTMLVLKADKFEKFTVGGSALQTLTTLSTKNFCLRLDVHLGVNKMKNSRPTTKPCRTEHMM